MTDDLRSATVLKKTIEACLSDGYSPFRSKVSGSRGSAPREAARRLSIPTSTVNDWLARQETLAGEGDYNWLPDWTLFSMASVAEPPPSDPIDLRRARDECAMLRTALKDAERRAADAEDVRASVLGLTKTPLRPHMQVPRSKPPHGRQAVVLHISDLHAGEVIRSSEILGSNKYDLATFRARIGRLFDTAAKLCTNHWPRDDRAPDEIIVCLGGDLISGSIHPELAETNEGTDYQLCREVAERIAGGLAHLRKVTGLPMRVYSVPGNHGRQTLKPQSKRQGLQSWDILVADFVESALRHDTEIEWFRSEGTDCYFDVVGWPVLLTHGHMMGAGGGTGFIGPIATIVRGHQKISHTELRQRRPIYLILTAHLHTTAKTPWGWGNGSLIGYNEYVRGFRGEPEEAQQNMFVFHEARGLIRWHPVYVGHPSEGSLYQGFKGWSAPMINELA